MERKFSQKSVKFYLKKIQNFLKTNTLIFRKFSDFFKFSNFFYKNYIFRIKYYNKWLLKKNLKLFIQYNRNICLLNFNFLYTFFFVD